MPKLLMDRLRDDSIKEFMDSARRRSMEAWAMLDCGHRLASIYLWGYAAETTLKAAWFRLIGHAATRAILPQDLRFAQQQANVLGVSWQGNLHNIQAWAELIVCQRQHIGRGYIDPRFGARLTQHVSTIYMRWRETLRYKANAAYLHEARSVAESTMWLLINSDSI